MRFSARTVIVVVSLFLLAAARVAGAQEMPITTASEPARTLYLQARDTADNLEIPAAQRLAEQAIAKDPDFALAHLMVSMLTTDSAQRLTELAKAKARMDAVSEGERHLILARQAQIDGDGAARKQHVDALLSSFPSDKHVLAFGGMYYGNVAGDRRKAAELFTKATTVDPRWAPAYNSLGYTQRALGDLTAAEGSFKKYIALLPDRVNPYDSYAELLQKMGRFDESIAQYRKALEKDPTFIASHVGIALDQIFKKDYAAARSELRAAMDQEKNPNLKMDLLENVAISQVYEGNTGGAVNTLMETGAGRKAAGSDRGDIDAHLTAAFVLADRGQADQAKTHLDAADGLMTRAELPQGAREGLQIQSALLRALTLASGRSTAAKAEAERVRPLIERRKNPMEQRRLHQALGQVALQQRQYAEALQHFAEADPSDPYVLFKEAMAHESLGHTSEATALYKKVATWNENAGFEYALVRSAAEEKAGPVATTGTRPPR